MAYFNDGPSFMIFVLMVLIVVLWSWYKGEDI